jgi:hypothetical protein
MSVFGKYGVGGSVPGKWPGAPDETVTDQTAACTGTDNRQPDSRPEVTPESFGSPAHNPPNMSPKASS